MKTIAIDTSLSRGSVAALQGHRLAVRWLEPAGAHAQLLAAAIANATGELGWRPADADLVAVVRGPGSFTGLRVGVTTAKALAWTTGCRLLGISGCEAFARVAAAAVAPRDAAAATATPVHVAYDAGRGELFAAVATPSSRSPTGWTVGAAGITAAADWVDGLPPGAIVAGPAVTLVSELLDRRPDLIVAGAGTTPSAADVAALAVARAAAGEADAPAGLVPEYMRQNYADEAAGRAGG